MTARGPLKILLVEDSRAVRAFVEGILRPEPDLVLLPPATTGREGVAAAGAHQPDVILMDLELPELDGIGAMREIMATAPRPIVAFSGYLDSPDRDRTFESFEAGAVDVLSKPQGLDEVAVRTFRERLLRTVRVMSEAKVVSRRPPCRPPPLPPGGSHGWEIAPGTYQIVAIGGSTGAPPLLHDFLRAIPSPSPVPIVLAQHIIPGFEEGLARWLSETGHRVRVVQGDEPFGKGAVYLAPADRDLVVRRTGVATQPAAGTLPPSVDVLFESVAESFAGSAAAFLLTGMGRDGARGLLSLRRKGALTVTQSAQTCVVDSMPNAARAAGASYHTLTPAEMMELLRAITR